MIRRINLRIRQYLLVLKIKRLNKLKNLNPSQWNQKIILSQIVKKSWKRSQWKIQLNLPNKWKKLRKNRIRLSKRRTIERKITKLLTKNLQTVQKQLLTKRKRMILRKLLRTKLNWFKKAKLILKPQLKNHQIRIRRRIQKLKRLMVQRIMLRRLNN